MATIHRLNLGHVVLPEWHPRGADGTCPLFGFAIDHPDGVIVVDTGTGAGHPVIDELYAPVVVSIVDALHDVGIDERAVAAVVNTHLHFDHCGQNHALPQTPVWVSQAELDTVATTEAYTVPEWAAIDPDRLRIAHDGQRIADGVAIMHTPGHTPGHLSVAVDTADGLELVVGQACYTCAEYADATTTLADAHDPDWHAVALDSLRRLHSLGPRRAHLSHDPTTWAAD